jgi:DNA-binding beta-propeller fold protein YncE
VYVADTGNRRIQVFSSVGHYLFSFGSSGSAPGQFQEPSSVAIGPGGKVYVSDFWNQRIQEFTASGRYLRSWSVPDWQAHTYDEPYLAVDPRSGRVFATDPHGQRVMEYTPTGRLVGAFGLGHLSVPIGIAVLPGGRIAVGDAASSHVLVFQVKGRVVTPAPGHEQGNRAPNAPKKP